jgi:hypothetical protein
MTESDCSDCDHVDAMVAESEPDTSSLWKCWGSDIPHSQFVFFFQMIVILIIICASIANLTLEKGDQTLWQTLLATTVGYALPNPKYKCKSV